jgi:predicted ferric reductase
MTSRTPSGPTATTSARHALTIDRHTALIVVWLGALMIATWPVFGAVTHPAPLLPVAAVARFSGLLAGYGVVILLVLVARAPALERGVGADVLTRWHAKGGRLVTTLVLLHACAAIAAWAQSRNEAVLVAAAQALAVPAVAAATAGTLLMLVAAGASARYARRRLRYERWHGVHLLMYAAIALSFGHMLVGPDLVGHRILQIGWALAYTHVFALVLRYRVITPLRRAARHRMCVTEVRAEGPDVVSIRVEGRHLDELRAEAGQFFRWRFLNPDHWLSAHPFSLSAPPTASTLRLTVKVQGDGTQDLQDLPAGTWVIAEGPYGAMTTSRRTRPNVLLIAGGVGITPMRSLFEAMPLTAVDDLLLLYRARTAEEVIFRGELDDIAARRGARVIYLLGTDRTQLSAAALRGFAPDLVRRDVYMCGPPALMADVRRSLRSAGLPSRQLHEERFMF